MRKRADDRGFIVVVVVLLLKLNDPLELKAVRDSKKELRMCERAIVEV